MHRIIASLIALLMSTFTAHTAHKAITSPPSQTVRGTVVNAATQQTIAGATVQILELKKGTTARPDGTFSIRDIPPGRFTVRASALGYEPVSMPLMVTSGKEQVLTLMLTERILKTDEISVNASQGGFAAMSEAAIVSSNVFTVDDAYRFAGARGDVSRMASAFAGVLSANDQRNDIIIRGGSPTELLWRLARCAVVDSCSSANTHLWNEIVPAIASARSIFRHGKSVCTRHQ